MQRSLSSKLKKKDVDGIEDVIIQCAIDMIVCAQTMVTKA